MPGQAPDTYTVDSVPSHGKVVINNHLYDLVPKDVPVSPGAEIRGWVNEKGKFGPYFKVAEDRAPQGRAAVRETNRSARIERQHSQEMALRALSLTYAPGERVNAALQSEIKRWTDWFQSDLDTASARSSSPPQADSGATNGADSGAQLSTGDDVPF